MLSNLKLNNSNEFYERGQTGVIDPIFHSEVIRESRQLNRQLAPVYEASDQKNGTIPIIKNKAYQKLTHWKKN